MAAAVLAGGLALASPTAGANLYKAGSFPALASDRRASQVGDSLTILIDQSATATNSAQKNTAKGSNLAGQFMAGSRLNQSLQLNLSNGFTGGGETDRSDKIVAEITVVVDQVLPNGDLHVAGDQSLDINGEHTKIRIMGRIRTADISAANTAPSTALGDAVIDYDGKGFVASSAKPGIVTRIFSWLGLI